MGLIFTTGIALGGWSFFHSRLAETRRTTHETLAATADLKAGEIASWLFCLLRFPEQDFAIYSQVACNDENRRELWEM